MAIKNCFERQKNPKDRELVCVREYKDRFDGFRKMQNNFRIEIKKKQSYCDISNDICLECG
jgi:hypothetical protein